MIAFRQDIPARAMDVAQYRKLLGAEADGYSDEDLEQQLEADRTLARALVTAMSTTARDSVKRVAS